MVWKERVRKERSHSFAHGIKSLVKHLINDCSTAENTAWRQQTDLDLFGEAFASSRETDGGGLASERRHLFQTECAAYLIMIAGLKFETDGRTLNQCDDLNALSNEVWTILADDAMMKRQEWSCSRSEERRVGKEC